MNIETLITTLKENFPNGCKDIKCKECPLYNVKASSPEDILCDLMSNLYEDYNNFEDKS